VDGSKAGLARRVGGREATGPRQEGGIFGRDEDIPLRRKSKCPNDVNRDRGGYLATRW
jgi:hypothetical protein